MLGSKTLLQFIIDEEVKTFVDTNSNIYESTPNFLDLNDGAFVAEIKTSSTAFQKVMSQEFQKSIINLECRSPDMYSRQLGERIIKLDSATINGNRPFDYTKALEIVYQTSLQVGSVFAGSLFILEHGGIVNPLHPLVALESFKKESMRVSKILVYTYKNESYIKQSYNESSYDNDDNIKTIIQLYQNLLTGRSVDIKENEYDIATKKIKQAYALGKLPGEHDAKEFYLVAHQLLTQGTYVPYYGTSIVQMGGQTAGFHASPFKSCNISGHMSSNPQSVCTGGTPNNTIEGLKTLHHANLGSPYEYNCMTTVSKAYADTCIKYSFDIYKSANIIK